MGGWGEPDLSNWLYKQLPYLKRHVESYLVFGRWNKKYLSKIPCGFRISSSLSVSSLLVSATYLH